MNFTRRKVLGAVGAATAALSAGLTGRVFAQSGPVKIGIGISQTGTLGGGGKAALLALQMWVDDVNGKGGLMGRKVELIAYDDQSNPATTPGIYTKLLDVDKVDLSLRRQRLDRGERCDPRQRFFRRFPAFFRSIDDRHDLRFAGFHVAGQMPIGGDRAETDYRAAQHGLTRLRIARERGR